MKMHEGEVNIDEKFVERLIAAQFPQWISLPIRAVPSTGTVNAIYRLGDNFCVRLPRVQQYVQSLHQELTWLPQLAPSLSLRIPDPVTTGKATSEFPFPWAIYRWLKGQPYTDDLIQDERQAAKDLAQFVSELRQINLTNAPRGGRKPLRELDVVTRAALAASRGVIDSEAAETAWADALEGPAWDGTPVWIHTDLLRPNLLVEGGRLCAVIDFGSAGVGDPAADVIAAWSVFSPTGRATFRAALDIDEATWNRARGYALHQAALIIPYYAESNPKFVALAKRTVEEILADVG